MYNVGKTVALVGYLLFYLNALGARVILQTNSKHGLGVIFDDDGVRGISEDEALIYKDGKPCYLLVSADGKIEYPRLKFCKTIAVTSPNLPSKLNLKEWSKQSRAKNFIAPPPSCLETVYLMYVELFNSHQLSTKWAY